MTEPVTEVRYMTPVTQADLEQQGFTPEQIRRLEELREQYPLAEFVTVDQRQKLQFVKWLRESGKLVS